MSFLDKSKMVIIHKRLMIVACVRNNRKVVNERANGFT